MKTTYLYISLIFLFTINLVSAQCYPDRHSTSWYDGWVSCEISANPNASNGESHWIMYDFGYDYTLNETKLWNANESANLDYGISEYTIDYSLDAVTWTNLGEFTLNQAPGSSVYEGEEGPDFEGIQARYVLITPTQNYGGDCYGLSEVKFSITDSFLIVDEEDGFNAQVYPNPFVDDITLRIISLDETAPIYYTLYDILGRAITSNTVSMQPDIMHYPLPIRGENLSIGIYILNVEQNGKKYSFKLIKRD